jgi:hypothetical protein
VTTVPRLWPGSTIVCLGDGPSLTREDVDYCRGKARVIAMNYSFRLAPWADVLWSYHSRGLQEWSGVDPATYAGVIFTAEPVPCNPAPNWRVLKLTGNDGLELGPHGLRHGNCSGYSAINLAVHLGAKRIVLLGYDCSADPVTNKFNWAKDADDKTRGAYSFALWQSRFRTLVGPLAKIGVVVLNASRRTALECFPRVALDEVLPAEVAA